MRYYLYTLGCKVNQFESQALDQLLAARGHTPVDSDADVIIINTCAVTAESGRKSRNAIRHLKALHPRALTAVCGCYSQAEPDKTADIGADIVFGTGNHTDFIEAIEDAVPCIFTDNPFERRCIEPLPAGAYAGRTRGLMRIQDGCHNFCTYCIIPHTRGRIRSQPIADAVKQAKALSAQGYKEIVITGIEIASYGRDLPDKPSLSDVLLRLSAAAPNVRFHLGSLEPTCITEDFCRSLSRCENICRHFHLSLQAGCDSTLKRMNRKYDTRLFLEKCEMLRDFFPRCLLTADVIVGFPGESEDDFMQSVRFMEQCKLGFVHVFPYSPRPGTPAASMPDQITSEEKENRARRAIQTVKNLQNEFLSSCIGTTMSVLYETDCAGHSENYCYVETAEKANRGEVQSVRITGCRDGILLGKRI